MTLTQLLEVLACATLGLLFGWAYCALLARNVDRYLGAGTTRSALLLHAARAIGVLAVFWAVAQLGGAALLSLLAGFVVARGACIRRIGNEQC